MSKSHFPASSLVTLLFLGASSQASELGPARAKWVGPTVTAPMGGELQTTIYYGPWQCNQRWMEQCDRKCSSEGLVRMGCIWIADIKMDWKGRYGIFPVYAGGRLAIRHCCCNYPTIKDSASVRKQWENVKQSFRRRWADEFGEWPTDAKGDSWPGHHIRDILHGGAPKADNNVLPVPPAIHDVLNKAYPQCYAGAAPWRTAGPDLPYSD